MRETGIRPLGREDPPEKAVATHSGILAWRIPWTEELGRQDIPVEHAQNSPQSPMPFIAEGRFALEGRPKFTPRKELLAGLSRTPPLGFVMEIQLNADAFVSAGSTSAFFPRDFQSCEMASCAVTLKIKRKLGANSHQCLRKVSHTCDAI